MNLPADETNKPLCFFVIETLLFSFNLICSFQKATEDILEIELYSAGGKTNPVFWTEHFTLYFNKN